MTEHNTEKDFFKGIKNAASLSTSIVTDTLRLARLELSLAEKTLPLLITLILVRVMLFVLVWIGLIALLITFLDNYGLLRAEISIIIAVILHAVAALIIGPYIKKYRGAVTFSATRKQLKFNLPK